MTTSKTVKLIECPRDAWQGLPGQIPTAIKAEYLRILVGAGFRHIDAVSFVSPAAVPQMADSELVLELLDPPDDVEIIGIVVNEKGSERAVRTHSVRTLGFPYSVSREFLRRNQGQTAEEALDALTKIMANASRWGLETVAYLSMAFGNPYGEQWQKEEVLASCRRLTELGVREISLADTVGVATPEEITSLVSAAISAIPGVEIGVHLHARPNATRERITAAYLAGCRRFDMNLGGGGGCPFAQDELVGNVATETALDALQQQGADLPRWRSMGELLTISKAISQKFRRPD